MKADKLYIGNVITMDERKPYAQAVAVKDGLIQYWEVKRSPAVCVMKRLK